MKRHGDWASRMYQAIDERSQKEFAWGSHDCLLFAADIVHAMTGEDLAKDIRGTYSSPGEAYRMLKRTHGGGIEEALEFLADEKGCIEIPPLMAQRGDVVIVETELGDSTAICVGETIAAAGLNTLMFLPLSMAKRAWRI